MSGPVVSGRRTLPGAAPEAVRARVGGVTMSGSRLVVPAPRAVLVALHGGGTTGAYYDCPGHPDLSLLRLAHRHGYTVLAPDRPGYGLSAALDDPGIDQRLDLIFGAVETFLGDLPRGAGIFLLAHSAGCELAVRMAGDPRSTDLLGLEVAGTGLRYHPEGAARLPALVPGERPVGVGDLIWHPSRLYPPGLRGSAALAAPGAPWEARALAAWPTGDFAALARRVTVPVRISVGEHELFWSNDTAALNEVGAIFTAAPEVVLNREPEAGHNLSLGHSACAYHRGVLEFLERCAIARTGETPDTAIRFDDGATSTPEGGR